MKKTITLMGEDGEEKQIDLKASAALLRIYRFKYGRDLFADMTKLRKAYAEESDDLNLETLEDITYLMAKYANPEGVPKTVEEWLEQFGMFEILKALPAIMELWAINAQTQSTSKKKSAPRRGK